MENHVEVTIALNPADAALLSDLAGGEANVAGYVAEMLHHVSAESPDLINDDYDGQSAVDGYSLIDLYG